MDGNTPATDLDELLQHSGWIRNLAYASLRDHALAEDVTQEVFIKALAAPRRSGRLLGAWLKAVTVNTARNEMRTRGRRQAREAKVARAEAIEQEQERDQDEVIAAFRKLTIALQDLAPQSRRIVSLRFLQEMSFREIAAQLSLSESHARVKLHRALKELRCAMERRQQNWRAECLLLAPATGFKKPIPWPTVSPQLLGLVAAVVAVGAIGLWSWKSMAAPAESAFLAVAPPGEETTTEVAVETQGDIVRLTSAPSHEESVLETPAALKKAKRLGRVFIDGEPASGVEIKVWQLGGASQTSTDAAGDFLFFVDPSTLTTASFLAEGRAKMVLLQPWDDQLLLVDLLDPPLGGMQVQVREGKDPIAGAKVEVYVDWSGSRRGAYARASTLKWVSRGVTNEQGVFFAPGWLSEMCVLLKVSAEGFLPKATSDTYVNLVRGQKLPVQLVFQNGTPVANLPLRQGFRVQHLEQTDARGFLPAVDDWRASDQMHEIAYLPGSIILHLPDGRIWHFDYDHYTDEMVEVLEDRIRITVDTAFIQVELVDFAIPQGHWVEVRCLDMNYPALVPENASALWQKLQLKTPTLLQVGLVGNALKSGMVGAPLEVKARLMPGATPLGEFSVKDGKAVIKPQPLCHYHFTLAGKSVQADSEFVAVIDRFLSPDFELPFVDGVADGYLPTALRATMDVSIMPRFGRRPLPIVGGSNLTWPQIRLRAESGGEVQHHFQELEFQLQEVLIRVDGLPVVGGSFGRSLIGLDGVGTLAIDEHGELLRDSLQLRLPVELHRRPGGPIFCSFYLGGRNKPVLPGELRKSQTGTWVWDFKLAQVELMTTSSQESRRGGQLSESLSGLRVRKSWPPRPNPWSRGDEIHAPEQGGALAFRVPAGRYLFRVKGENFGGAEGVELPAGQLTVLQPDPQE